MLATYMIFLTGTLVMCLLSSLLIVQTRFRTGYRKSAKMKGHYA